VKKTMKTFGDKNWQITLSEGWVGEDEVELKAIYHPQGAGELIISSYLHDKVINDDDLLGNRHLVDPLEDLW